jgi:hypothetical protein
MAANANTRASIVLQNRESLLYLTEDGKWTDDVARASKFEHVADASSFARRAKIGLLDIVMTFGDPKYDVRLSASA